MERGLFSSKLPIYKPIIKVEVQCPRGCAKTIPSENGRIICSSCGLVLKQEDFEQEIFESGALFDFSKQRGHDENNSTNEVSLEKRQREIDRHISEFNTKVNLDYCERKEILQYVQALLRIKDMRKQKCKSLRILVGACFYWHCKRNGIDFSLNSICKHFSIKISSLLKESKGFQDLTLSSDQTKNPSVEGQQLLNSLRPTIHKLLIEVSESSYLASTYQPAEGQLFSTQMRERTEDNFQEKTTQIIAKASKLLMSESLSTKRMGKHLKNVVCTIIWIVMKSIGSQFQDNSFCFLFGIQQSTLSRDKTELLLFLLDIFLSRKDETQPPEDIQKQLFPVPSSTRQFSIALIRFLVEFILQNEGAQLNSSCLHLAQGDESPDSSLKNYLNNRQHISHHQNDDSFSYESQEPNF